LTSISNPTLLLIVLLLQQLLFGLLWMGAARLRLARRPALHWAAMAWLEASGLALILLRGQAPPWLSVGLGNGLVLVAFVVLRRGIQRFARLPTSDREHGLVMGLGVLSALGTAWTDLNPLPSVLLVAGAMAWTLLRAAREVRDALAAEFGRTAASWCALPMATLALLLLVRAALAVLSPIGFARYLEQPGGGGVDAALVALFIALLLQVNLTAMVLLRLVRRLQYQSDHDLLTGLFSRRPMERLLLAESQRQRRFGQRFALLSVDIDHFKTVNDGWGHAAGDAVLTRVAGALRTGARDIDSVARMGGEEFCLLLPGADEAGAHGVAVRLLETVRALHHPEIDGAVVTISIGLAVMEAPDEPLQALQLRLDQALYSAKAAGRDRVAHAVPAAGAVRA
jgi:diguanylate cyclase (GGDEF)-like protein